MVNGGGDACEDVIEFVFKCNSAWEGDVFAESECSGHDEEGKEQGHDGAGGHHDGEAAHGDDLGDEQGSESDGNGEDSPESGVPELLESEFGGLIGSEAVGCAKFSVVHDNMGARADGDDGDHGVEHGADHAELGTDENEECSGADDAADDDEEWSGDPSWAAEDGEEHESEDGEGGGVEGISVTFDEVEHFLNLHGFPGDEGVESGVLGDGADLANGLSAGDTGVSWGAELEDDGCGVLIGSDEESLKDIEHSGAAIFISERRVEEAMEVASAITVDTWEFGEFCGEGGDVLGGSGGEFVVACGGIFLEELWFVPCDDDEFVAAEVGSGLLELEDIGMLSGEEGFDGLIELEFLGDGE